MAGATTDAERWAPVALTPAAARWLLAPAGLVALVVRVAFLADKPFWRDEAWVAWLVVQPLHAIATPQASRPVPVGFVGLVKLTALIPGIVPEVTFRLLPLLIGLAVLPALAWFGLSLGATMPTIVIAVWLAAGMPALVYYSRELKPYDIDLLIALLVPALALRLFSRGAGSGRQPSGALIGAALALALAAAPWLSFGGVCPIVATLGWGWALWWRPAATPVRRVWTIATLLFLCSLAAVYELALAEQSTTPWLRAWWAPYRFAAGGGSMFAQLSDAVRRYVALSTTYLFPDHWQAALGLAALGLAAWPGRQRWFLAWLAVGSAAVAIGLALADRYLLAHGRLLLFAAPPLLLLAAAGLERVARLAFGRAGAGIAIGLAALLALAWSGAAIRHRLPPYRNDVSGYFFYDILHDVDALTARATEIVPAGEPLLISICSSWPFMYYGRGRLPDATLCVEPCPTYPSVRDTFLNGIARRGWIMLVDEEVGSLSSAAASAGVVPQRVAAARGVQLWELTRPLPPPS